MSVEDVFLGLKKKIALVRLWPGVQNGETESAERIKLATKKIGVECLEIDPDGVCVETGKVITSDDVDFAIHLHFETPKRYDIFSFVALWNPLQFYFDWGYEQYSKHLLTHDDFLSCLSPAADDHVKRLMTNQSLRLPPKFTMFHSLSEPIIKPTVKQRNLFYIGINWERLGSGKSRHGGLLKKLDKTGILRIYGPHIFLNVNVWKGYKSYVKELLFDGVSVINEISEVGAGLVFSSEAHKESGLMSNRLFETVAAGAVAICDENSFVREHFGDTVLYVDSKAEDLFEQVMSHMSWMNDNPEDARDLVIKAQKIFIEKFTLDRSLLNIYQGFEERKKELSFDVDHSSLQSPKVVLIYIFTDESQDTIDSFMRSCGRQDYANKKLFVVIDNDFKKRDAIKRVLERTAIDYGFIELEGIYSSYKKKMGSVVAKILKIIRNDEFDYFNIIASHEEIFHNHVSSLVNILKKDSDALVASIGAILKYTGDKKAPSYLQDSCVFDDDVYSMPIGYARFMFSRKVIEDSVFCLLPYLDKKCLFSLVGNRDVKPSSLVTGVINWGADIFHERLDARLEGLLIQDVFSNRVKITASIVEHIEQSSAYRFVELCKLYARKIPMPHWVYRFLFKAYKIAHKRLEKQKKSSEVKFMFNVSFDRKKMS